MTDTLTPLRKVDPSQPPGRGRGPLLAMAVAAVLILIIGVASFTLLSGDEQPVATDPPAPTTTAAPTTTLASLPQSRLPADTPAIEVVAELREAYAAGSALLAETLILPDSHYFTEGLAPGVSREISYRFVTGMNLDAECAIGTPAQIEPWTFRFASSEMVTCTETLTSGLELGAVVGGGTVAYEVADGWIVEVIIVDYAGGLAERTGLDNYRNWLQEIAPDRYPSLFDETTSEIIVETPEAQEGHRELVPFFLADTGPRPEGALPADTSLVDVVDEFHRRWDAGDVEGYEAIINPEIGYPPGNDASASWFGAVTGVTTERTCTEFDAITLRCQEIVYWGLVPGDSSESTLEYVARNGWILAITFLEGETSTVQPDDAPGVDEYRAWVQDNLPDRFETLFAFGVSMRLDTEELRALHKETVAEYLAATS